MNLYRVEYDDPKANAQRCLAGRTHYVDDDTLRFHKSRILHTCVLRDGLLFGLIESMALDMDNTRRGYRYVLFDVFGQVVGERLPLDGALRSSDAARKAMLAAVEKLDAKALTLKEISRQERMHREEMKQFRATVRGLKAK